MILKGVIFGVSFSDDGKTISSVSDDRTIRIWKTDRNDKYYDFFVELFSGRLF
jgi:WD40 repeat protein